MNPTKRKVTGLGVAVSAAALMILIVGFVARSGEALTVGGCALLLVGACYLLAPRNLHELDVRIQLPPRFFACRSVTAIIELTNRRELLSAWGVEILIRFPHKVKRSGYAASIPAQGTSSLKERVSLPARAACSKVDCELRSTFPLGFFEVSRVCVVDCPAVVYPRLITPVELQLDGSQPELNPIAGFGLGDMFGEPRGIRPYQPGDKATRIHPFATAHALMRGQGLQVRAFDPPGFHPDSCRIVFHSYARAGEVVRLDRFERGLSLVAGALAHFHSGQTKVSFQADFDHWRCHPCLNRAQYFECLALLTRARRSRQTTAQDLAEVMQQTPAHEQLIVVSDVPPDNWEDLVPANHRRAILVDIRQVRFKARDLQLQPASKP